MFCMIFVVIKFYGKTVFRIDDKARTIVERINAVKLIGKYKM